MFQKNSPIVENRKIFETVKQNIKSQNFNFRLSLAYHFKQQCESSDMRLRQYFGIRFYDNKRDATTNTDFPTPNENKLNEDEDDDLKVKKTRSKRRSRYKPKTELKKRGPKPTPKVI